MADDAADFAFLAETAARGIADLRRALRRPPLEEGERGAQFVCAAEAVLSAIEDDLAQRREDYSGDADETDQEALVRALRQITHNIRNVHSTTPWIEAAHEARLPLGLVYLIDEIAAALVQRRADVITVPSADYMYSMQHKPFMQELSALQRPYPDDAMPIVVHYPAQEIESLLLHLVIAHELGHSAIVEHDLLTKAAALAEDQELLQRRLGDAVNELVEIESGADASDATLFVGGCFVRWVMEAICDALAIGFLVPSFLLTAAAFLTPFAGPQPSDSHPPQNLRTQLLLDYLQVWGWMPLLEAAVPTTLSWLTATAATEMDSGDKKYFETIGGVVRDLAGPVEQVVSEHLGDARLRPESYEEQAEEIRAMLATGILPAQLVTGAPADRRNVLLAGWLHACADEGDAPEKLPVVLGKRDYQAFLAKALEMSAVLERWRETA